MDSPHVRTRPWKTGWGGSWPLMMILACTCLGKYRFFSCTHGCASALCIYGAGHKLSFTHYTTKGQWSGCRWRSFYIAHILTHTLLTLFYTNLKKVDCIRNKWKKKYTFAIPEVLCVHNKQWVLLHRRVQSDQSECDTHFFSSCILVLTIQTGFIRELVTKAERGTKGARWRSVTLNFASLRKIRNM